MDTKFLNSGRYDNTKKLRLIARRVILVFTFSSISYVFAQEDRPLPALESQEKKEVQRDDITSQSFYTRATNAVTIDVRRVINNVALVARNNSSYPYSITLRFRKVRNLLPHPDSVARFVIMPGTKPFMNFKIFDSTQSFDVDFTADKKIGTHATEPIPGFPYLFPVRENRSIQLPSRYANDRNRDLQPMFRLDKGDTVCAMRKGVVTAIPFTQERIDRIVANSVEVMHIDGTVMVYENMDSSGKFVRLGETVYPGEPIGTVQSSELSVSLYLVAEEKIKKIEIAFYLKHDTVVPFSKIENGIIVRHPKAVIGRELNRKELRNIRR